MCRLHFVILARITEATVKKRDTMKKTIAILLLLALCLWLCACGEEVVLPAKPAQVQQNENQSAASKSEAMEENAEITGETYLWEAEFNEKDYVKFNVTAPGGEKVTTWKEGSMFGTERRYLCRYLFGKPLSG